MVTITEVRQFWDRRPCNLRHSLAPPGSFMWSREVTKRRYAVEPHIPEFAQFPRWHSKWVLDLGCGIGTDALSFVRAHAKVTAVDVSNVSLGLLRDRYAVERPGGSLTILRADIEHLTEYHHTGQWFDLVWCFGVLHHTPHPRMALFQVRQVLQPTGEFRLMLYHRWSLRGITLMLRRPWLSIDRAIARQSEAQEGCPITRTYTKRSARRLMEDAGFEIESMRYAHVFPYRIRDYRNGELRPRLLRRIMPNPLWRAMERALGWHLLIVAKLPSRS